jgi:7-cyano-7-deazaguanine synthase
LDDAQFTQASAQAVWVPDIRNGIFLEAASGFAVKLRGASHVIVGFNREEAATFPYNSSSYLNAINKALAFSTQGRVQIVSPTVMMDKSEIVAWAD